MKKWIKMAVLGLAVTSLSGCASMVQFNVPKEFEGKKKIEDPPLSLAPQLVPVGSVERQSA